jgi:hypothetical protein
MNITHGTIISGEIFGGNLKRFTIETLQKDTNIILGESVCVVTLTSDDLFQLKSLRLYLKKDLFAEHESKAFIHSLNSILGTPTEDL